MTGVGDVGIMPGKNKDQRYSIGDRVKINTGSRYITSVDDCFGKVVGFTEDINVVLVETEDETLGIHVARLQKA